MEEKLKEKHKDSSILGVCHTCHTAIHHGEVIYTPHDYSNKESWHAEGAGVGSVNGGVGAGVGAGRGGDGRHSVSEGWIQCGFCYQEYHKELEVFNNYNKKVQITIGIWAVLGAIMACGIGCFAGDKKTFLNDRRLILYLIAGAFVGASIGNFIRYATQGSKPNEPNRYKLRVKERKAYDLKTKKQIK